MQVTVGGGSMISHVCTLVNVLVGERKTPPVQVAGDGPLQVQVKSLR